MADRILWTTEEVRARQGAASIQSVNKTLRRAGIRPVTRQPGKHGQNLYDANEVQRMLSDRPGQGARTDLGDDARTILALEFNTVTGETVADFILTALGEFVEDYDLAGIEAEYRSALEQALAAVDIYFIGEQFHPRYLAREGAEELVREAIGSVDIFEIVARHEKPEHEPPAS